MRRTAPPSSSARVRRHDRGVVESRTDRRRTHQIRLRRRLAVPVPRALTDVVLEAALRALAERGQWIGSPDGASELLRIELRHACRTAGIRIRTGIDARGRVWVTTPDGLPGHEPWHGAAVHALESGVEEAAAMHALERIIRGSPPDSPAVAE